MINSNSNREAMMGKNNEYGAEYDLPIGLDESYGTSVAVYPDGQTIVINGWNKWVMSSPEEMLEYLNKIDLTNELAITIIAIKAVIEGLKRHTSA